MDTGTHKKKIKDFPQDSGVYIFWLKKTPLYIGKAKNLRARVESYFAQNLAPKTSRMVSESERLSFIRVDSELEALLLEATLIKKYQPRYNSAAKDDKHPLYIKITKEKYPRIITARKIDESQSSSFFGPFPSSSNVRSVLRMLRRIFPYSDHKLGKRGCLYSQLGECNPCPNEIEKEKDEGIKKGLRRKYLENIRMIKNVLSRKILKVERELEGRMQKASEEEKYEEATLIREQIRKLAYITQPIIPSEYFLENPNLFEDIRKKELGELKTMLAKEGIKAKALTRIECYDVAHLGGVSPTASMVTFIDGEADKNYYRHFRIRNLKGMDDIASLTEVAKRRVKYLLSWGKPNLIVVDGGRTQVSAFYQVFGSFNIPVVGLAKRFETLVIPRTRERLTFKEVRLRSGPVLNLLQRMRDEAHRFARRYHHKLIQKSLLA